MKKGAQAIFRRTAARLEEWRRDERVVGVLHVGSKSRGHGDELSDDDLEVVLTGEAHARLTPSECIEYVFEGEGEARRLVYDAQYVSLPFLAAKRNSAQDLDRWPYERAVVLFDRDGRTGEAVRAAGEMSEEFRRARLRHATVDAGIAARRAAKTLRRGMDGAGRLLVARGAKALARILFALEHRWVPLDHWLEPELKTLADEARAGDDLIAALREGSPELLQRTLARLEDRLFAEGIPRPEGRAELFFELIHPTRAEERAVHGLN
ncbi:MAG TPA: hypothetical protein VFX96_18300 [Pyrinomonadaceae bacterium]|nr:hypothetical protein [Pyrinomonadaceae bacterium]